MTAPWSILAALLAVMAGSAGAFAALVWLAVRAEAREAFPDEL